MRALFAIAGLAGCSTGPSDHLSYAWDDRRVLCSDAIDDLEKPVNWPFIESELRQAEREKWAVMLHAHEPGVTVSTEAIEHVLSYADTHHLSYVTFSELVPGPERGALALAFDDNWPDQWMTLRNTLGAHHARVTFFITRWYEYTDAQRAEIKTLAADGHDIEPHTVHHLHANDYVAHAGLDAYMTDEVLPSFDVLTAAGYPTLTSFAYPFGEHSAEIDEAVLQHVDRVRTTPGSCPW
jgi:peptidoglycan/xylan/chitin deacetylase (PgdA/CDA1 family)